MKHSIRLPLRSSGIEARVENEIIMEWAIHLGAPQSNQSIPECSIRIYNSIKLYPEIL